LFLLHYYLAAKDDKLEHYCEYLTYKSRSRFMYEVRTSSGEFCTALMHFKPSIEEPSEKNLKQLSNEIRNQKWFKLSWNHDPTIVSMLNMLDAIHHKFYFADNYYQRLTRENDPVITFQFLNLNDFNLTDELYIKMNARGRSLTPYENFKARFEQYIEGLDKTELGREFFLELGEEVRLVDLKEYFSFNLDTIWLSPFWELQKKYIDLDNPEKYKIKDLGENVLNFIKLQAVYRSTKKKDLREHTRTLINLKNSNGLYEQFYETDVFSNQFVIELIDLFNLLIDPLFETAKKETESKYLNFEEAFIESINGYQDAGYSKRILFYAGYKYLLEWKSTEGINDWLRVIYNLTTNTLPYNDEGEFTRSILAIDKLIPHSANIYLYLSRGVNELSGFNANQIKEECVKSRLILKSEEWKEIILNTENNFPYLTNQIDCLLDFSGIYNSYYNLESVSEQDDKVFKEKLKKYSQCLNTIIGTKGIREYDGYLIERALLTKGDYTLHKSKNKSFLIAYDRDISWKRFLSRDTTNRYYLKELFDDNTFDYKDASFSFDKIIEAYQFNPDYWQDYFIDCPQLFESIKSTRLVRFLEQKNVRLLTSSSIGGYQFELRSLHLYYKELEPDKNSFSEFKSLRYHNNHGQYGKPCAVLEGWKFDENNFVIDVYYEPKDDMYGLRFFDRHGFDIPELFAVFLKTKNFKSIDDQGFLILKERSEVKDYLITLTQELSTL